MNHSDAQSDGVGWGGEMDLLAEDLHRPFVGRLHAVENLHQGRFAGTVLTANGVDLPFLDGEVHALVGDHSREALGYACQLNGRCQGTLRWTSSGTGQ